jgi:hypothetical protein
LRLLVIWIILQHGICLVCHQGFCGNRASRDEPLLRLFASLFLLIPVPGHAVFRTMLTKLFWWTKRGVAEEPRAIGRLASSCVQSAVTLAPVRNGQLLGGAGRRGSVTDVR